MSKWLSHKVFFKSALVLFFVIFNTTSLILPVFAAFPSDSPPTRGYEASLTNKHSIVASPEAGSWGWFNDPALQGDPATFVGDDTEKINSNYRITFSINLTGTEHLGGNGPGKGAYIEFWFLEKRQGEIDTKNDNNKCFRDEFYHKDPTCDPKGISRFLCKIQTNQTCSADHLWDPNTDVVTAIRRGGSVGGTIEYLEKRKDGKSPFQVDAAAGKIRYYFDEEIGESHDKDWFMFVFKDIPNKLKGNKDVLVRTSLDKDYGDGTHLGQFYWGTGADIDGECGNVDDEDVGERVACFAGNAKRWVSNFAESVLSFIPNFFSAVINFFTGIVTAIGWVLIKVVIWLLNLVISESDYIISYADPDAGTVDSAAVIGFNIMLQIANVGFIIGIIIIGFATILHRTTYAMEKALPRLIVTAVIINFSIFFAQILIGLSNSVTHIFADGVADSISITGAFEKTISVFSNKGWGAIGGVGLALLNFFFTIIFLVIAIFAILAAVIMFIIRYVYLSILVILLPMALILAIFPGLKLGGAGGAWNKWQGKFTSWLLFGPVAMFFIWLAFQVVARQNEAVNPSPILMLVAMGLIVGGLMVAEKLGLSGSEAAGQLSGWAMKKGAAGLSRAGQKARGWQKAAVSEKSRKLDLQSGALVTSQAGDRFGAKKYGEPSNALQNMNELKPVAPKQAEAKPPKSEPKYDITGELISPPITSTLNTVKSPGAAPTPSEKYPMAGEMDRVAPNEEPKKVEVQVEPPAEVKPEFESFSESVRKAKEAAKERMKKVKGGAKATLVGAKDIVRHPWDTFVKGETPVGQVMGKGVDKILSKGAHLEPEPGKLGEILKKDLPKELFGDLGHGPLAGLIGHSDKEKKMKDFDKRIEKTDKLIKLLEKHERRESLSNEEEKKIELLIKIAGSSGKAKVLLGNQKSNFVEGKLKTQFGIEDVKGATPKKKSSAEAHPEPEENDDEESSNHPPGH